MNYIKENIINLLPDDPIKLIQELTSGLGNYYEYYSLMNLDNIKLLLENLGKHSFFFVRGGEGSGKNSYKRVINNCIDDNIKIFEFNCSEVTELDDIFFAFYKFMQKNPIKKDIFRTNQLMTNSNSIDEQIMYYLKHYNGQLIVEFTNFQKLLDSNLELKAQNLKSFFEFVSINQTIKTIIYTSVNLNGVMDIPDENICKIQLSGLAEEQIKDFFAIFKCDVPQSLISEIYQKTNGYIYSLRFFAGALKILDLPASAIVKEANTYGGDFNKFLAKKLITKLSESEKKVLLYLALFRHEITENVLKSIDHFINVSKDIEVLKNYMLVEGEKKYELRSFLKEYLYDSISPREKIKFHEKIAVFYADQIPLKPNERVIEISRTSMYTEKFYHYNISTKLSKNSQLQSSRSGNVPQQPEGKLDSAQIKYIASAQYFPTFDIKQPEECEDTDDGKITDKDKDEEDIKLSAEEKALLKDNSEDNYVELDSSSGSASGYGSYFGNSYNYVPIDTENNIKDDFYENPEEIILFTEEDEITKAKKLLEKGINLFQEGNLHEGITYLKNATTLLQNKDDESFYSAKLTLAKALAENFKLAEAKENINDLMTCDISLTIKVDSLIELASITVNEQNYLEAEKLYNYAIEIANENNLQSQASKAYFKLALLFDDKDDINKALTYYLLACDNAEKSQNYIILAAAYSNIASIYEEQKDINNAIDYYKKSLKIDELTDNYEGQTKTLSCLGNIFYNRNAVEEAIKLFIKETKIAKKTEDTYLIASAFLELGDIFFNTKDYKNALRAFSLAKKNIDNTISTDSKNKIERRFDMIVDAIGENAYNFLLMELKNE